MKTFRTHIIRALCASFLLTIAISASAQTQNRSANQALDEPIALPKEDAGRVRVQLNGKTSAQNGGSVLVKDGIETQRIGGVTTIRVNSEIGTSYSMSNGQAGNKLRARDHDEFRVPLWRLGQF